MDAELSRSLREIRKPKSGRAAPARRDFLQARQGAAALAGMKTARRMLVEGKRIGRGIYQVNPEQWMALCEAVDRYFAAMEGAS